MTEENAVIEAPAPVADTTFEGALEAIAQRRAAEEVPEPAAPETPDAPAETPAAEVAPPPTPAPEKTTPEVTPETPAPDWREAIKSVDVAELLQLKGVDDKVAKLFDKYAKDGDLSDYFKAYSVDYDKVPDTDMLRMKIDEKYAGFSDEERQDMYEAELEKYKLDADQYDEKEVRRAKIALKADVADARAAMKAKQAESLVPTKDFTAEQAAKAAKETQALQQYATQVKESEAYKKVAATKVIKIGEGENAFNMDVDPDYAVKYLTDNDTYTAAHMGADGKPDFEKQILMSAFAKDPKGFMDKLLSHTGKVSQRQLVQELGNETPPAANGSVPAAKDLTPAQILLNSGNVRF